MLNAQASFKEENSKQKFDLEERTIKFSEEVIAFVRQLKQDTITKPLISQLVRSATSIGANYSEAEEANSKKDFVNKVAIAKKETRETKYWLRILSSTIPESKDGARILCNHPQRKQETLSFTVSCLFAVRGSEEPSGS
jgi:four helix bundle protein